MKQKIIVKVQMNCHKCRTKALKTAANVYGVDYVALGGDDRDQIVVTGDGVDPVKLTKSLRKIGRAAIVSVEEVKPSQDKEKSIILPYTTILASQPRFEMIEDCGSITYQKKCLQAQHHHLTFFQDKNTPYQTVLLQQHLM